MYFGDQLIASSFLLHALKAAWRTRVTLFFPIWVALTVAIAASVRWVVGDAATPKTQTEEKVPVNLTQTCPSVWSRGAVAALVFLALFLVGYIVLILRWEDFSYYDGSQFTLFTLRGYNFSPPIWPQMGRFFPLGHQEFNLVRHFTTSIVGYHVLPIVQLLIFSCILLILDDALSLTARAGLTLLVLVTPGIMISFGGLIYTERNILFWFACLALLVKRFEQTGWPGWAVAAVVSAQILVYYKETAFLLLCGLAVGRLILRCRTSGRPHWDFHRLRDMESRLDLCLAAVGILFLFYYAVVMLPHPNINYAAQTRLAPAEAILNYAKLDLLAWFFVVFVAGRFYMIFRHGTAASPMWDGLALGAVGYLASYLYLRMYAPYFLAPVDLIAVLYVGRFLVLSRKTLPLWSKSIALVLLLAVLFQDLSLSAFHVFERKNLIHSKAEIASLVKDRYGDAGTVRRLYFPFASPYVLMEFASYLTYRGVPVQGGPAGPAGRTRLEIVSRTVAHDGPCVNYRDFLCHTGALPEQGDLVIVLPDDGATLDEIAPYRTGGDLLLSYEPLPDVPHWLHSYVNCLHVASNRFMSRELPDGWLRASVIAWR